MIKAIQEEEENVDNTQIQPKDQEVAPFEPQLVQDDLEMVFLSYPTIIIIQLFKQDASHTLVNLLGQTTTVSISWYGECCTAGTSTTRRRGHSFHQW